MSTLYMVHTNPMPGKEKEFNEWYEGHVLEVVELGGFRSGRRAVIDTFQSRPEQPYRYVAIYETDDQSPQEFFARLKAAESQMYIDRDVIDLDKTFVTIYRTISDHEAAPKNGAPQID